MSHLVFLVHGMGIHETGWESQYIDALDAAYEQYELLSQKPLRERFTFVPLSYDEIFRELVSNWATNAEFVDRAATEAGVSKTQLTGWLKGADVTDANFKWTHAADVLMYKAFSLVRERVCQHVGNQIVQALAKQIQDEGRSLWSVVAHSLGTAVIHDTLARLWDSQSTAPGHVAFSAQNEQAQVIAMVANVSRLLETKTANEPYDVFKTAVAPGRMAQAGRGCLYYFNARHRLDPFTIPKMFSPQMWPDEAALLASPPRYAHVEVDHIHMWNVHDFGHYMKNPKVHVPLLRRLVSSLAITDEEYAMTLAKFRTFGSLQDEAAIRIRQKLEDATESQADDWLVLGRIWQAFTGKGQSGGFA